MRLYFGGGDSPSWRKRLLANDVKRIACNFTDLLPRLPQKKDWVLDEHFPDDVDLLLYWSPKEWSEADLVEFDRRYVAFAEASQGRLINALQSPLGNLDGAIPVWDGTTRAEHVLLEADDNIVAMTAAQLEDRKARAFMATVRHRRGQILGLGVSDERVLQGLVAAISSSWISATRYGETVVWDGSRLRRFPATRKAEVRQRYRAAILRAGVDHQAVLDDDKEAVVALTLWSWHQMEESMVKRRLRSVALPEDEDEFDDENRVGRFGDPASDDFLDVDDHPVVQTDQEGGTSGGLEHVVERPQTPLPILMTTKREVEEKDGTKREVEALEISGSTLRQCNTCAVADKCPGFRPDHRCAYSIPIEVRTKDQLTHLLTGMLEMQSQRVLFARMAEELDGGYPDPNLSNEMDRLFILTEKFKEISDNRDFINIQVEAKGQAGVLSRLFGDHIGEQARALPSGGTSPEQTDALLKEALDIEDAEVVSEN